MEKGISGIYSIKNTTNNKIYIGSSINLSMRIAGHKSRLKSKRHINSHLQSSYNKYGAESFIFEIVERVDEPDLLEREAFWIDYFRSSDAVNGYNKQSIDINSGRQIVTEEKKRKLSTYSGNKNSQFGVKRSEEFKKAISLRNTGFKHTEEQKKKMSENLRGICRNPNLERKREFYMISPSGELTNIKGLREFCKNNNLNSGSIYRVLNGKNLHAKGWTKQL